MACRAWLRWPQAGHRRRRFLGCVAGRDLPMNFHQRHRRNVRVDLLLICVAVMVKIPLRRGRHRPEVFDKAMSRFIWVNSRSKDLLYSFQAIAAGYLTPVSMRRCADFLTRSMELQRGKRRMSLVHAISASTRYVNFQFLQTFACRSIQTP